MPNRWTSEPEIAAESPEFTLLMGALEDRVAGRYYSPPPDDAATAE
ncbi:hypothetical protein ACT17Q_01020 [Cellulomonas sp. CW35]|nr:hypothetical protein [Cellulomonas sp. PSBB021]